MPQLRASSTAVLMQRPTTIIITCNLLLWVESVRMYLEGLYCGGADLCLDKNLIRSLHAALVAVGLTCHIPDSLPQLYWNSGLLIQLYTVTQNTNETLRHVIIEVHFKAYI